MINLLSKGTRVRWSAELFWLTKVVPTSKKFEKRCHRVKKICCPWQEENPDSTVCSQVFCTELFVLVFSTSSLTLLRVSIRQVKECRIKRKNSGLVVTVTMCQLIFTHLRRQLEYWTALNVRSICKPDTLVALCKETIKRYLSAAITSPKNKMLRRSVNSSYVHV
jgi:hypothetical protein